MNQTNNRYEIHEIHEKSGQTTDGQPLFWAKIREVKCDCPDKTCNGIHLKKDIQELPSPQPNNRCVASDISYLSNPPQSKCKNCGQMWFQGKEIPICQTNNRIREGWRDKLDWKWRCFECLYINSPKREFQFQEMLDDVAELLKSQREEERQFILNILDGIDKADEEMGNTGGGTKTIRLALQSRI